MLKVFFSFHSGSVLGPFFLFLGPFFLFLGPFLYLAALMLDLLQQVNQPCLSKAGGNLTWARF